jgi:hypothetical protein
LLDAQYTVSESGRGGVGESIDFVNEELKIKDEELKVENGA